jgi:hypothetical protein
VTAATTPAGLTVNVTYNGSATAPTAAGSYAVAATVNDADYAGTQPGTLIILKAPTNLSLTLSAASADPGSPVTIAAAVATAASTTPSGTVTFYADGSTTALGTATLSSGVASLTTTALAAGATHTISATYSGDANFATSSATASGSIVIAPLDFTLTTSGTDVGTVSGGSPASFQLVVTPEFGVYAAPVTFAATDVPPGVTVTFSPASVAANAGKTTVTMVVSSGSTTARNEKPSPMGGMAPYSLALLLLLPGAGLMRRRGRKFGQMLCLLLLAAGAVATTFTVTGCGSQFAFTPTSEKTYTMTLTATSGTLQHSIPIIVTVK